VKPIGLSKAFKGMLNSPVFVADVRRLSRGGFDPRRPRDLKVIRLLARTVEVELMYQAAELKEN